MNEDDILSKLAKKNNPNSPTAKYGVFGCSLGIDLYQQLTNYCRMNNISKASLIRTLIKNYLDNVKSKENINV
jgi:hypothetical protein